MNYKLKLGQEAFEPVEGSFAGRKFAPGKLYNEIPPGTEGKFDQAPDAAPAAAALDPDVKKPAQRAGQRGAAAGAPENGEVK